MTSQSSPDRIARLSNEILEATSFLYGTNAHFIEALYAQYLENPDSVEPSWRAWFTELGERGLNATQ
jgi:2-oxoglutarate dehydrogenase E1 component